MLDMLIQGGRVVTPAGVGNWDVGIVGEQIVAVAFPGILPTTAKQVIDARGKIVVPGGIETHAHAVANVQPGAGTYFVHVTAKEGLDAVAEARSRGLPIYGEVLTLALSFTADRYREPDGMKYHTYPSLKGEEDHRYLWDGLLRGELSFTATDSSFTTFLDKLAGRNVVDVRGGNIGIEIRMGVNYTEAVVRRGMSLEDYAAVTSTNAAKLLGLYPRKGAIAIGSDADITIIDPAVQKTLSMADLHVRDYSPWEGWQVEGWPTTVILRGKVMVDNGRLLGSPTDGRLIPRKIDPAVLRRPAF